MAPSAHLFLLLLTASSLLIASSGVSTSVSWLAVNGGDWNDPNNWSSGQVPGAAANVYIETAPCSVAVSQPSTINSINVSASCSLTLSSSLTVSGMIPGAAFGADIGGQLVFEGGSMNVSTGTQSRRVFVTSGSKILAKYRTNLLHFLAHLRPSI